jgi:AcrR family transcriptional regulator
LTNIKNFPLRERKKAKIRLGILDAVIDRLYSKSLDDIKVEEICDDVQISKGTFFQYFPQKTDVLVLYGLLWNLEAMWYTTKSPNISPGLSAIEYIFTTLSQKVDQHPRLWMDIIAIRALQPHKFAQMGSRETDQVSTVERLIRFPKLKGIESIPEGNFSGLFYLNLEAAIKKGELPKETDLNTVHMSLACIFYGVPLMSFDKETINCSDAYQNQLHLLWKGVGARNSLFLGNATSSSFVSKQ